MATTEDTEAVVAIVRKLCHAYARAAMARQAAADAPPESAAGIWQAAAVLRAACEAEWATLRRALRRLAANGAERRADQPTAELVALVEGNAPAEQAGGNKEGGGTGN